MPTSSSNDVNLMDEQRTNTESNEFNSVPGKILRRSSSMSTASGMMVVNRKASMSTQSKEIQKMAQQQLIFSSGQSSVFAVRVCSLGRSHHSDFINLLPWRLFFLGLYCTGQPGCGASVKDDLHVGA